MGCLSLTLVGGGAEVLGLLLVALELALSQRKEFPGRGPLAALLRFLQRLRLRLGRQSTPVDLSATVSGGGSLTATASLTVETPPQGLEERIERLEERHTKLEQRLAAMTEDFSQRVASLGQQLADQGEALGGRVDRLEAQRREQLEQSLRLQWPGTFLFVAGVVLSVGGNALTSGSARCPSSLWSVAVVVGFLLAGAGLFFVASVRRRQAETTDASVT